MRPVAPVVVLLGAVFAALALGGAPEPRRSAALRPPPPQGLVRQAPVPSSAATNGPGAAPTAPAPRAPATPQKTRVRLPLPAARAAAQVFLVGFAGTDGTAAVFESLRRRDWGGVLVERGNYTDAVQLQGLTSQLTAAAAESSHAPPLIAARQPGGSASAFADLPPPAPSEQATPAAARAAARSAGRSLRELGVTMVLAPDADLAVAAGPAARVAFGDDPRDVGRKARAAVRGWRGAEVVSAVGHFPGEGAATEDPQTGPASVGLDLEQLRKADLLPFAAVAATAPVVQVSNAAYIAFDGVTPATLLPTAMRLLRRTTRFKGVVLSGDLSVARVAAGVSPGQAAVTALRAGTDLLLLPGSANDQEAAYRAVLAALRSGAIRPERMRDALERIAALKRRFAIGG